MKTLLIVFHSRTGGAQQMAESARQGAAREPQVAVRMLPATEAGAPDLLAADGYIFTAPENLATMSGPMKDFFDRAYYEVLDRIAGRAYAILVCAGSDGHGAVRQIERICTGWRLKLIAPPLIVCTHAQTPEAIWSPKRIAAEDLAACEEIGAGLAAGLGLGIY